MILQGKNAVIYGAGGSLGGAVAKALAAAGANLFLTGHHIGPVQTLAEEISASGSHVQTDQVDAMDEKAVTNHLHKMLGKAGTVDISFNATGTRVVQNIPLTDIAVDDFMGPIKFMLQSQFLTAIAAATMMMKQRSGTILSLTATPGGIGYPFTGGFAPACSAIESFSRNLASELGKYGVRVINMRSGGSPDSKVFKEAMEREPELMKIVIGKMEADTMLKKLPSMSDIANLAVFLASPMAAGITGVTVDVTCGTTAALNYKVE